MIWEELKLVEFTKQHELYILWNAQEEMYEVWLYQLIIKHFNKVIVYSNERTLRK